MFLSLVHIYIRVVNQQLFGVVHFLHSLICSIRKTPLNDACECQCCGVFEFYSPAVALHLFALLSVYQSICLCFVDLC